MKAAIRGVLLRKKGQEIVEKLRTASKIEILDGDLKKFYEQAAQQAKAQEDKQNGQVPAAGEGESDGAGKGDLLIPQ